MARKLIVEVVGDSRSYERALGRANAATNTFNANIAKTTTASQGLRGALSTTKAGGGLGGLLFGSTAFVGAAIATKTLSTTINAASDMNEQLSKSNVVFGKSAEAISDWSKTTATAIGISRVEAVKAAATFGSLFSNTGQTQENAAAMSKTVVELAGDLASFNNTSTSDALDALRSGLSGEIEPLRRFQVFLTEAAVAQRAMAETGKTSATQLTQGEKITARYGLILEQTTKAQGDFARTSDSLANQQRVLQAQTANLAAKVGTVLLPAMTALVTGLNDGIAGANELADALGKLAAISGIEVPIKLVTSFGGGHGGRLTQDILRHVLLGPVSPALLGFAIGKEIADGIRGGVADAVPEAGAGRHSAGRAAAIAAGRAAAAAPAAAAAAIAKATRRANVSLNQQISESGQRIAHLKDLIREDPSNAKLQQRLTAEIKTQNGLIEQQKQLNKSNAAAVKASGQAAHDAAVQAAADARDAAEAAADRRRERIKSQQFRALGLTPEGLKPTPGSGSLLRRAVGLQDQIKGTVLDTDKNRTQLKRIVDFLKKNFHKAGRDVREAILGMLNDISDAFDNKGPGAKKQGPLTSTHGLRTAQIIKNLGLSAEQADEIQRRLAHATVGGRLRGTSTTSPGTSTRPARTASSTGKDNIFVESHTTIKLDGKILANVVTRNQQKDRRRNPKQKRGPHRR